LGKDIGETQNLAESMPDKVKELDTELVAALKKQDAKLPKKNPPYSKK